MLGFISIILLYVTKSMQTNPNVSGENVDEQRRFCAMHQDFWFSMGNNSLRDLKSIGYEKFDFLKNGIEINTVIDCLSIANFALLHFNEIEKLSLMKNLDPVLLKIYFDYVCESMLMNPSKLESNSRKIAYILFMVSGLDWYGVVNKNQKVDVSFKSYIISLLRVPTDLSVFIVPSFYKNMTSLGLKLDASCYKVLLIVCNLINKFFMFSDLNTQKWLVEISSRCVSLLDKLEDNLVFDSFFLGLALLPFTVIPSKVLRENMKMLISMIKKDTNLGYLILYIFNYASLFFSIGFDRDSINFLNDNNLFTPIISVFIGVCKILLKDHGRSDINLEELKSRFKDLHILSRDILELAVNRPEFLDKRKDGSSILYLFDSNKCFLDRIIGKYFAYYKRGLGSVKNKTKSTKCDEEGFAELLL